MGALRSEFSDHKETDGRVVDLRGASSNETLRSILKHPRNYEVNDIEAVVTLLSKASNEIDEVHRRNKEIESSASRIIFQFKKEASEAKDRAENLRNEVDELKDENEKTRSEAKVRVQELESALKTLRLDLERIAQERDQATRWLEHVRSQITDLLSEAPRTARPNKQRASFADNDAA
jgi:predicted  nucleic acid-binding Zn-ribbon protein